ncbi:DMT family transporter [Patescibacteria group bacterium]|nr:DMT family transporter [Patescibacteria group bacterium]
MPLWIPIAFLAVILWVIGNLIDKHLIEHFRNDADSDTDANTLFMFSSLFAVPTALFALFMGANFRIDQLNILLGISAGLLNGIYLLLYLHALAKTELSRIAPVFQSIPVFTAIFGWIFLHEVLTQTQLIAGAFLIVGATILSYHKSTSKFMLLPVVYILIASAAIALQVTLFKAAALDTSFWTGMFWSSIGLIVFGLGVYAYNTRSRVHINAVFAKRNYKLIGLNLFNELIDNAAMFIFLFATLLGPIALVQTVHAYHPVILLIVTTIAMKLGFKSLKEDVSQGALIQKVGGLAFVCIGSALIYIPLI